MPSHRRSILHSLPAFLGVAAFLTVSGTATGQAAESPWPMFQHDAQRTGRSPHTGPTVPGVKWLFPAGSNHASPTIAPDGTIYIGGSADNTLYALYPDGTLKWQFPATGQVNGAAAIAADGTVYVSPMAPNTTLYALNPADGSVKWTLPSAGGNDLYPAIGPDGTLYFTAHLVLYAVNPDGTVKWTLDKGPQDYYASMATDPALLPDGATVYVGTSYARMYAVNAADGTWKWTFHVGSAPAEVVLFTPTVADDGTIHVGFTYTYYSSGAAVAVNPDGTHAWSLPVGTHVYRVMGIGADGTVYADVWVDYYTGWLCAITAEGALRWCFEGEGGVGVTSDGAAIDAAGIVYATFDDHHLYALNPDGTLRWRHYLGGSTAYSSPAIVRDGTIYGGYEFGVYAIGPVNRAPAADAGPDQAVDEGSAVTLQGAGTDADGDPLEFAWTQTGGPLVALSDPSSPAPSFTAPLVGTDTLLTFQLTVSDGVAAASDTVVVTVRDTGPTTVAAARTVGYGKNHREHLQAMLDAGAIDLGGQVVATVADAVGVLGNASARDARTALGAQLLATVLNLRNGSDPLAAGGDIRPVVAAATAFLATHPDPVRGKHPDRAAALALKDALDGYNNSGE